VKISFLHQDEDFCSSDEVKIFKDEDEGDEEKELASNEELQAALVPISRIAVFGQILHPRISDKFSFQNLGQILMLSFRTIFLSNLGRISDKCLYTLELSDKFVS
jgi:hypothetical protein